VKSLNWRVAPCAYGRGAVLLAGIAIVAAIATQGIAAPTASAARGALLAPRDGAKLPARPVTVVLRDARRVIDPSARLNGTRVRKRFTAPRNGRRRLVLTAAEGLRHGTNRLVVRYGIRRRRESRSVRFTVSSRRPLAGPRQAGVPGVAGERTVLDGRRSRARPRRTRVPVVAGQRSGPRRGAIVAGARQALKYRWRLLRAPRGSRYARRGARALRPRSHTAARVRLKPDKRGTYVFQLRVHDGVPSAPAMVEVDALPTRPMLPVSVTGGAIQVGDDVYRPSQASGRSMHLVVLDRRTLELVSDTTIVCPTPPGPGPACSQQTENAVAGLTSDQLVIAAAVGPWAGQDAALASIGVAPVGIAYFQYPGTGFGAIGVPGMSPGEATQRFNFLDLDDPGISGYLTRDRHYNYSFSSGDQLEYQLDTVAGTLTVGGQTFQPNPPPVPNCDGGFHLWSFDPMAMGGPNEVETWCTNVAGDGGRSWAEQQEMIAALTNAYPNHLLFVSSFGNPVYYYTLAGWAELALAFEYIGGFHHVLNTIESGPYTLVSPVDARGTAGTGIETSTETPGPAATRPVGVLARDNWSRYRPVIMDATRQGQYDLLQTAYQRSTPWPIPNTDGQSAALSYIVGQLNDRYPTMGTDIRDDYWTQSYDDGVWASINSDLGELQYPGDGQGFTQNDFTTVQQELETEIAWLINVMSYINGPRGLSKPFTQGALEDWAQVAAIAQDVDADIGTDDSDTATGSTLDVIGDVLDIAAVFVEEAEPELGLAAGALFIAADLADAEDGTSGTDPVQASVANFGAALAQRFQDAQTSYERLQDIIVSDYGKLKTVGTLGGCSASDQNCPPQWQWTQESIDDASTALFVSTRRELYEAFIGLKYVAWNISDYTLGDPSQIFCRTQPGAQDIGFYPFPNTAQNGGYIWVHDGPEDYQVTNLVIASPDQASDGSYTTPSQSVLTTLYGAVLVNQSYLNIYLPYLYLKNLKRPVFGPCAYEPP
jgi:hypothetical protein